jgi:hypothetical protein
MISLQSPVILFPPAFTNEKNQIVNPNPIILSHLDVSYVDTPMKKNVSAHINGLPGSFSLFSGSEYDSIGDWTQEQAETRLRSHIGQTPEEIQKTLQSIFPQTLEQNPNGPGSILTGMISSLGIKSSADCSCRRHAIEMNQRGPDWCEENITTILSWLKEESHKRNLPYIEIVAKAMVQRAINKSRRLLEKEKQNEQTR